MMARLSLLFNVGYRVVRERFGVIHGSPVQHMPSVAFLHFSLSLFFLFLMYCIFLFIDF